jgi:hypothetical protein
MIHFTRTSSIAPGQVGPALAFAREMSEYLRTTYDLAVELHMPVGGNPNRVRWSSSYPSLAAMEDFQAKTMSDQKYLQILGKAATLFIAGSVHDEIWRSF